MAKKQKTINVEGREIIITQVNEEDYISLTSMVGEGKRVSLVIQNWLRNKNTLEFLAIDSFDSNVVQCRTESYLGETFPF